MILTLQMIELQIVVEDSTVNVHGKVGMLPGKHFLHQHSLGHLRGWGAGFKMKCAL